MAPFQDQISKLVNDFVAQVSALAREAAMEALEGALSGSPSSNGGGRRSAGAPTVQITPRLLPKGAKRPANQIEAVKAHLLDFIKSNPGQRVEQINKAIGTKTKELALPLKKLLAEGAIKSEGERRATAYYPNKRKQA